LRCVAVTTLHIVHDRLNNVSHRLTYHTML
jgi:hypothetical protein